MVDKLFKMVKDKKKHIEDLNFEIEILNEKILHEANNSSEIIRNRVIGELTEEEFKDYLISNLKLNGIIHVDKTLILRNNTTTAVCFNIKHEYSDKILYVHVPVKYVNVEDYHQSTQSYMSLCYIDGCCHKGLLLLDNLNILVDFFKVLGYVKFEEVIKLNHEGIKGLIEYYC